MTCIILNIADENINETLKHYGKMIGVDMMIASENADFIMVHQEQILQITDLSGLVVQQFELPINLFELGKGLLQLQTKNHNHLVPLSEAYALDENKRAIINVQANQIICELTEKESEMLAYIVMSGSVGADKDEILQHVWGYNPNVKSRTVEVHLYRLRQKLAEIGDASLTINVIDGKCFWDYDL
jgi:hypothetical protein